MINLNWNLEKKIESSLFLQWLVLLILTFIVFYPSLLFPYLDIDELIWGEMANTIVDGCPPYTCVVGGKPPLLYLFYSAVFFLFGKNNYFALHFIHILWVALTAFLLNRATSNKASFFPGIFYILLLGLPGFRNLAITGESLLNLFLILSWGLFLKWRPSPSLLKFFLVGFLVGLASLFRQQGGIQIAVYAVCIFFLGKFFVEKPLGFLKKSSLVIALGTGFVTIWALASLLLFFWGSWESFRFWALQNPLDYINRGGHAPGIWKSGLVNNLQLYGSTIVFWVLGWLGWRGKSQKQEPTRSTALLYLVGSIFAACVGFRFFPHYFIQAFPPLAFLASLGFLRLAQNPSRKLAYKLSLVGLILSFLAIGLQNIFITKIMESDETKDYSMINQRVGNYIRERTKPNDRIFVWGWGQGIYYFSDRQIGTRFISSDYLTGRVPGSDPKLYLPDEAQKYTSAPWKMLFSDLKNVRSVYFVNTSPAKIHDYQYFPPHRYPVLREFLDQHYQFEIRIEGVELYKLKAWQ